MWLNSSEYIKTFSKANLNDPPKHTEKLQGNSGSCLSPMLTVTPADVKLKHLKLSMPLVLLKTTSKAVSKQQTASREEKYIAQ